MVFMGPLDYQASRSLRDRIQAVVRSHDGPVIVDMMDVHFLDTAGMSLLMDIQSEVAERPILRLAHGSQPERLILLGHLDSLFLVQTERPAIEPWATPVKL